MHAELLRWFEREGRTLPWRKAYSPYSIWVSESMLCQTQVERVIPRYHLWMEHFPDVFALAQAPLETLLRLWEGLGYYARPRYMQEAARMVVDMFRGEFPPDYHILRKLPGVGDYTACAILSIAYNLPYPTLDGNAKRVFARLLDLDVPIEMRETQKRIFAAFSALIPEGKARFFNQAIMDLGSLVCVPRKPRCEACPIKDHCLARERHTQAVRPVKAKIRPKEVDAVLVFFCRGDTVLIRQRPENGFLAGLWEVPWKENASVEEVVASYFPRGSLSLPILMGEVRHAYCNRRVRADVFVLAVDDREISFSGQYRWERWDRLETYPFASFHRKAIMLGKKFLADAKGR